MFGRIFGAEKLKEIFQFYFNKTKGNSVSHESKELGEKGRGAQYCQSPWRGAGFYYN